MYVCMYMYIYIYINTYIHICHTYISVTLLIAWVQFLWSRPQTTSHVVQVQPGGDRKIVRACESQNGTGATWYWSNQEAIEISCVRVRAEMEQGPHGTGPARRRSMFEKDCARAKMEQEQSKCDRARE